MDSFGFGTIVSSPGCQLAGQTSPYWSLNWNAEHILGVSVKKIPKNSFEKMAKVWYSEVQISSEAQVPMKKWGWIPSDGIKLKAHLE